MLYFKLIGAIFVSFRLSRKQYFFSFWRGGRFQAGWFIDTIEKCNQSNAIILTM